MTCFASLQMMTTKCLKKFAEENPEYTRHLIGYGIISSGKAGHYFNMEMLKKYLSSKHKYEKINILKTKCGQKFHTGEIKSNNHCVCW